ncbi:hypothetical protein M3Y97_00309900 [Aphelenchoides bicaudatus]|nr:hypothetical protein M3Y97_00309900 [Aphelenchoides bicaudatus]
MPSRRNTVDPNSNDDTRLLRNRPKSSKFRQQKLPAWQPILTAQTAIPTIFATGMIFIPLGVFLLLAADSVKEWSIEYGTICRNKLCSIDVQIDEQFSGNVYFYYGLDNYFQNHRRYVKSRSDSQLLGYLTNVGDCSPLDYVNTTFGRLPIAPCGSIANSMFNDTFQLLDPNGQPVPLTKEGVIWEIDRDVRFKNPPIQPGQDLCEAFRGTIRPPNWQKDACQLDPLHPDNNGFLNVDFIVWMRTAALPSFRKLYRILDRNSPNFAYQHGLPAGRYRLSIENNYPVDAFNGKKSFIISTTTWSGGHNNFLGIAYIVIGSICILLGFIFTVIHIKFGHSFAEMAEISINTR